MNITFLIGNGFDINIGMKTQYKEFYRYYIKTPSKNTLIISLKNELSVDYETWANFELKFGEYLSKLSSEEDFDIVYSDVKKHLAIYLKDDELKYQFENAEAYHLFIDDLVNSNTYLSNGDKRNVSNFIKLYGDEFNINIITFNYTSSIEKLLKYSPTKEFEFPSLTHNSKKINLCGIYHIHGTTEKGMILGVNDLSQIKNEKLQASKTVQYALIKPICNKIQKHLIDEQCEHIISNTNLFYTFGLSLGETDSHWWNLVAKRIDISESRLVIFYKDNDIIIPNEEWRIGVKEDYIKDILEKRSAIKIRNEDRIVIGYNEKIFNFGVYSELD